MKKALIFYNTISNDENNIDGIIKQLKQYISKNEIYDDEIDIIINKDASYTTDDLIQYLTSNYTIKEIYIANIETLSISYKQMVKLTDFCFNRNVNIIAPLQEMALVEKGNISAKFKTRIIIDTDFERFD